MCRELCSVVIAALMYSGFLSTAHAFDTSVSTTDELRAAIDQASPGDVITLAAGNYAVGSKISVDTDGTQAAPITLRAAALGDATLRVDTPEGIALNAAHWRIENIDMVGVCGDDSDCEHAIHMSGPADGTHITHCRLRDFNAQIKSNGTTDGANGQRIFPDDVVIEYNEFFDSRPRQTSLPVAKLDVVGGRRWVVRANSIHDFDKAHGDRVSYAAFLKGNSRDGLFDKNLVACASLHRGHTRLGLSFGGGGTGSKYCEGGSCPTEHQNGVMRNNIIINCSDVGIYLNKAANTKLYNNTVLATTGIDARFDTTRADIRNNLVTGRIKNRNGGQSSRSANVVTDMATAESWFPDPTRADYSSVSAAGTTRLVDAGEALAEVDDDYCGQSRDDGAIDIGAVEYVSGGACDTTIIGQTPGPTDGGDTGPGGPDAGGQPDAGRPADTGGQADGGPTTTPDATADPGGDVGPGRDTAHADAGATDDENELHESSGDGDGCSTGGPPTRSPPVIGWMFAAMGLALLFKHRR